MVKIGLLLSVLILYKKRASMARDHTGTARRHTPRNYWANFYDSWTGAVAVAMVFFKNILSDIIGPQNQKLAILP